MQRDLTPPYVDDSLLEIVGFRDAWHGLVLLAPKGHGTRLAQVSHETVRASNLDDLEISMGKKKSCSDY